MNGIAMHRRNTTTTMERATQTLTQYPVGQILFLDGQFYRKGQDGVVRMLSPQAAREYVMGLRNAPASQDSNQPSEIRLEDNDLLFRSIYPIGRVTAEIIYETRPANPDHPVPITPITGDLLLRSGAPVAKFENNMFREWRPHPQG
ncbi:uncharacterized protein LOC117172443 isoform X2 [Belonocnema kinseyi]|nr:uncharacterized protein LOC117172443 isoform X2 [Belonocnema kinseyi]XP_033216305.1 uncharacterized protein LOC117172443 isoform X2 [Belonocnema kinseyi]XP_033216314.1 uncharacterized protein LOC117172443 isoform X2 [Belonocnema kinseyi]XP_033216322.1 uncharacterized protein LOC117172443 isoform X2 [Belonocnema kinseyi]XP_033216331.1 uncharacterized protein LOC117172443 isoform X2 [Belonocnema kinseyi]XP_033216338.1 uncharacterized protein LOC117172443 isoform X2 [Belonocnema kinseyi]